MKLVPETYEEVIGLRLKEIRNSCGIDQKQAAAALGIAQSGISKIETSRTVVNVVQLLKLARLYGWTPHELIIDIESYAKEHGL